MSELHRDAIETTSIPVNETIRHYFENGNGDTSSKEDWLQKPELPTAEEILGVDEPSDDVLLAPNQISGPWPSKHEYLKTHYCLIREDSVAPLRDAVTMVRNNPQMHDAKNISIYEKVSSFHGQDCKSILDSLFTLDQVFITKITLAQRGIAFRIRFSTKRAGKKILWEYSNRLISSSVVALSPVQDAFATKCVVAVVAARPLENVAKNPPEIDILFARPEDVDFDPQQEWLMVESRNGYFEAHRHTMTALQKLSKER